MTRSPITRTFYRRALVGARGAFDSIPRTPATAWLNEAELLVSDQESLQSTLTGCAWVASRATFCRELQGAVSQLAASSGLPSVRGLFIENLRRAGQPRERGSPGRSQCRSSRRPSGRPPICA